MKFLVFLYYGASSTCQFDTSKTDILFHFCQKWISFTLDEITFRCTLNIFDPDDNQQKNIKFLDTIKFLVVNISLKNSSGFQVFTSFVSFL